MEDHPPSIEPSELRDPFADLLDALTGHFSGGQAGLGHLNAAAVTELQAGLEKGGFLSPDMKHLWLMLEKALHHSGRDPGAGREAVSLLNLACGHCEEGAVLSAFFGRQGKKVRQFAMDLRGREIETAQRRYAGTEELFRKAGIPGVREEGENNTVEFIADNALRLAGYGQIPAEFDVVFIRHQNLWHDREVWRRIFEFSLHRIEAAHGLLIITSYFDREHLLALEMIRKLGGAILFTAQNPNTRALDYPGKSVDRHVAAIARI